MPFLQKSNSFLLSRPSSPSPSKLKPSKEGVEALHLSGRILVVDLLN